MLHILLTKKKNFTLQFLIIVFGLLLLSGCATFFASRYIDVSQDPRFEHLIGHWVELKQDVFLFQFSDTRTYSLNVAGKWSGLPSSIEEYQKDPSNWQNTDSYAQKRMGPKQGYFKEKVIAVIPKGTKLYVEKIQETTHYESFIKVIAYLNIPQYLNLPVNIYSLFEKNYVRILIPYPSEPELSAMGREITLYPKPGVIEYCAE